MAESVIENVALAIVAELGNVDGESPYDIKLTNVIREPRKGYSPRHLLAVVMQQFEDEAGQEQGQGQVIIVMPIVWTVRVFNTPSDDDATALDTYANRIWTDVTTAITANWNDGTSNIDTLVYRWEVLAPQLGVASDGGHEFVDCRYRSLIRFNENDPRTQR